MTPVTLTPSIVAKAALQAHAEKRLCAQNITDATPQAYNFYRHATKPGVACAVGAALDDEHAARAVYPASNNRPDVIAFPTPEDARIIDHIQELHDEWTSTQNRGQPEALVEKAEKAFLNLCRKYAND